LIIPPKSEPWLRRLFASDALRAINDQVVNFAAPTLALVTFHMSAREASFISMGQWLPALILGGVAGRLADRFPRQRVIAIGALISAMAIAMMWLSSLVPSALQFPVIFGAVLLYAATGVSTGVTSGAFVPALARGVPVSDAISMQSGVRSSARIAGQAIAGPLTQFFSAAVAFGISACVAVLAAVMVLKLDVERQGVAGAITRDNAAFSPWRTVLHDPVLRAMTLLSFVMNIGGAIIQGAFFAYAYNVLQLPPIAVGLMLFLGGISAVFTAHFSRRLLSTYSAGRLCMASGILSSTSVWLIPAASYAASLFVLIVYEIIFSAAATVFVISFAVLRQSVVPNHQLGQLISVSTTVSAASIVVGTSIAALLVGVIGVQASIVLGCVVASLGTLCTVGFSRGRGKAGACDPPVAAER
jgi:predicted MFS family arabinose efflux permease